jgi:hypothetical protein
MSSSDRTFALATSAKRPERKSELYEERVTEAPVVGRIDRFRSVKRTPEEPEEDEEPFVVVDGMLAIAAAAVAVAKVMIGGVVVVVVVVVDAEVRNGRYVYMGSCEVLLGKQDQKTTRNKGTAGGEGSCEVGETSKITAGEQEEICYGGKGGGGTELYSLFVPSVRPFQR